MLNLILFRHGKSDWNAAYANDHERPLANRGREAARQMGLMLRHADQVPELAISSSALRARDTLHLAARAGRWDCEMRSDSRLYEATAAEVVDWLHGLQGAPATLLLTGHEPTWSELASLLIGDARIKVSTGSMLRIDFGATRWSEVTPGSGLLRWLIPPKLLGRPIRR